MAYTYNPRTQEKGRKTTNLDSIETLSQKQASKQTHKQRNKELLGKGICHQAWGPEFNPYDPHCRKHTHNEYNWKNKQTENPKHFPHEIFGRIYQWSHLALVSSLLEVFIHKTSSVDAELLKLLLMQIMVVWILRLGLSFKLLGFGLERWLSI